MFITVSICTRNRSASLARTLASIERVRRTVDDWELLVTDNGSGDDTQEVIRSFSQRLPIRSQTEIRTGVANARNMAAVAARGTHMVWTDDDVCVDREWLAAYAACFARWPQVDLFAGRITPVLEEPRRFWFEQISPQLEGLLAIRDLGDEPMVLKPHNRYIPYGANFAVRTTVQRAFPFDPQRGPGAGYFGEETSVFLALLRSGHEGRWVPEARVQHMISPKRQTEAYIRWWYESLGRTVVWEGQEQLAGPYLFGAPRWLWRKVVTGELKYRLARMTAPPEVWGRQLIQVSLDRGRLRHFRPPRAELH